jgi:hypothetical protein
MGGCRGIVPLAPAGGFDLYPSGTNPDGVVFPGINIPDPFSSYQTWYMDLNLGVDPTPGSHQSAGYVYATLQAAVNDVFYASGLGARRLIIRSNAVWAGGSSTLYVYTQTTPATFPSVSGIAGTPYVVQGDPAVNGLPYFDGGAIHNGGTQSRTGGIFFFSGTNSYITVRKVGALNHCNAIMRCSGTQTFLVFEYCACHDVYYNTQGDSGVGFLASGFNQAMSQITLRYCNVYNFGTISQNNVAMETYGSDNVTVYNCYFAAIIFQLRLKLFGDGTGTADNWNVYNNIFSNGFNSISHGTQNNTAKSPVTWTISNNLFYGSFPAYGHGGSAWGCGLLVGVTTLGSGISWTNNTFGQDINNGPGWAGSTGLVFRDNVVMATAKQWSSGRSATSNSDVVFAQADYNAYLGAGSAGWHLNMDASTYSTFALWQAATGVPDLAVITSPDPNGVNIQALGGGFNTVAANFPSFASHNYTLAGGSPLNTASSIGGPLGCNMNVSNDNGSNGIGPCWFA